MQDNIDTDQIIPSREMKTVSGEGLGKGLFAGQRYLSPDTRDLNPDFVLNKPQHEDASILLAGANFGCGSSREHAVWALADFGIRCVIAESFGAIFQANCGRNGVLPISLDRAAIDAMAALVARVAQRHQIEVNLDKQWVRVTEGPKNEYDFQIDPYQKRLLIGGLDPVNLTSKRQVDIDAFFQRDASARPWIYE